ncbi:MAG: hypothetical protein K6E28_04880 [Eubacterium sp.]|nr:hypothetical protein [Eubacterium sp.]
MKRFIAFLMVAVLVIASLIPASFSAFADTNGSMDIASSGDAVSIGAEQIDEDFTKELCYEEKDKYKLTLKYSSDAGIPDGASLQVEELTGSNALKTAGQVIGYEEDDHMAYSEILDISIMSGASLVVPKGRIHVTVEIYNEDLSGNLPKAVSIPDEVFEYDTEEIEEYLERIKESKDNKTIDNETLDKDYPDSYEIECRSEIVGQKAVIEFEAEELTPVAFVSVLRRQNLEVYPDGTGDDNKKIELDGLMPIEADAEAVDVTETLTVQDAEANTVTDAAEAGKTIAAYDISIKSGVDEYQPSTDYPIHVEITDSRIDSTKEFRLWHVKEDGTREEVEDFTIEDGKVSFDACGFSIYEIEEVEDFSGNTVPKVKKVEDIGDGGYYISITKNNKTTYMMNVINATNYIRSTENILKGAVWHFEEKGNGKYIIYTKKAGIKNYLKMTKNSSSKDYWMSFVTDAEEAEEFDISLHKNNEGYFYIYNTDNAGINISGSGKGFQGWPDKNDMGARVELTPVVEDAANLDGMTVGIVCYKSGKSDGGALMAALKSSDQNLLDSKRTVAKVNPLTDELVLSAGEEDISLWTFQHIEDNNYYLTSEAGGREKYLSIKNDKLELLDVPDGSCILTVTQGTGDLAGKIRISNSDDYALNLVGGNSTSGFKSVKPSSGNDLNEWLNPVSMSNLTEDDFITYSADKVGVTEIVNGQKVIVYTRVWNDEIKKYEYFIIDQDGHLITAKETGDTIRWNGLKVNSLLWDFTEYYYEGTSEPNYYYELQNTYSGKYIAPQIKGGQILSDSPIGINMNGRRNGDYGTTFLAWDDASYAYAGVKINDDTTAVESGRMSHAHDFYFALVNSNETDFTYAKTIDNDDYGITMKMIDFNGDKVKIPYGDRNKIQYDTMGEASFNYNNDGKLGGDAMADILNSYLSDDGYPAVKINEGHSLSELFSGATKVNQLFLDKTHNETGYFEYNCTQNFAYLDPATNNFKVYDQIASIPSKNKFYSHGQFLPYNQLTYGKYSQNSNETNELGDPLPPDDPRAAMPLYLVENPNYFFGMELSAGFTQTVSGEDAWGHDIIFEFAGDDDFWLYVDGMLVIDLGGVHDALRGSVNFKTGEVVVNKTNTTLKELFRKAYIDKETDRTGTAPDEATVEAYLNSVFDGEVFTDYSTHNMKVFYMERGAGASNLHLRFNLSAVKPGQVMLSKKVLGNNDDVDLSIIDHPFQIYYRPKAVDEGGTAESKDFILLGDDDKHTTVNYSNSLKNVKYMSSYKPGGADTEYKNVFFLKAGETVYINFPEDTMEYYIVECGINNEIYNEVKCNQETLTGTANGTRHDFQCSNSDVISRPAVLFENSLNADALRSVSITKELKDENGNPLTYEDDPTTFNYRLYLQNESDSGNMPYAYLHKYFVKDPDGNYCQYVPGATDEEEGSFASIGKSVKSALTEEEKDIVTFYTSPNGSISKIPTGYTVEVDSVPVGTIFKVEERKDELPTGYTLEKYARLKNSYLLPEPENQNIGVVQATNESQESPQMLITNRRGWGVTANKVWSDAGYVKDREPIYAAIFPTLRKGTVADIEQYLLEGSIRKLTFPDTSLYWYFDSIDDHVFTDGTRCSFSNYEVREVSITGAEGTDYTVDEEGKVTVVNPSSFNVLPVTDGTFADIKVTDLANNEKTYAYTVSYEDGVPKGKSDFKNSKESTITNTRGGGIQMRLGKWSSDPTNPLRTITDPLGGGVFSLKLNKPGGEIVDLGEYKSGPNGNIAVLYDYELGSDYVYELTETAAPAGYIGAPETIRFYIEKDPGTGKNTVHILNNDEDGWTNRIQRDTEKYLIADINVFNKTFTFSAVKYNADMTETLKGAVFALYKEVESSDGSMVKDYYPYSGCERIETGADGILTGLDNSLPAGNYYITEIKPPHGYNKIDKDIVFSISNRGVVSFVKNPAGCEITKTGTEIDANNHYEIKIPNTEGETGKRLTLSKNVAGNMGNRYKEFQFTVKLESSDGSGGYLPVSGTFAAEYSDGSLVDGGISFDENGVAVISLRHGEAININGIPKNTHVSVTESAYASEGYIISDLTLKVGTADTETVIADGETAELPAGSDAVLEENAGDGTKTISFDMKDDIETAYTNRRAGIIPTGIFMNTVMLILVGCIALLGINIIFIRRRRS